MPVDLTPNRGYKMPHIDNSMRLVDVPNFRETITAIDGGMGIPAVHENTGDEAQSVRSIFDAITVNVLHFRRSTDPATEWSLAIQRAIDFVALKGGGRVEMPATQTGVIYKSKVLTGGNNVALDLKGSTLVFDDVASKQQFIDIPNNTLFAICNGTVEGRGEPSPGVYNYPSLRVIRINNDAAFHGTDLKVVATSRSDDSTSYFAGIYHQGSNGVVILRKVESHDCPVAWRLEGNFSVDIDGAILRGTSYCYHRFVSSAAYGAPVKIHLRNVHASGNKPHPTQFGYQINRDFGPRITCRPQYFNVVGVGNVDGNGDPLTHQGATHAGMADIFPWQGVEGGLQVGCGAENGGDSGFSDTRASRGIHHVGCWARNIEGVGGNLNNGFYELDVANTGTFAAEDSASTTNDKRLGLGSTGAGLVTAVSGDVITLGSLFPATILNTAVTTLWDAEGRKAVATNATAKTVTLDTGLGLGFSVGDRVFIDASAVAIYDRKIDGTEFFVYGLTGGESAVGQTVRSLTGVETITGLREGGNHTMSGCEFIECGLNNDSAGGSYGGVYMSTGNNNRLIGCTIRSSKNPLMNGVILDDTLDNIIDVNFDVTGTDVLVSGPGALSSYTDLRHSPPVFTPGAALTLNGTGRYSPVAGIHVVDVNGGSGGASVQDLTEIAIGNRDGEIVGLQLLTSLRKINVKNNAVIKVPSGSDYLLANNRTILLFRFDKQAATWTLINEPLRAFASGVVQRKMRGVANVFHHPDGKGSTASAVITANRFYVQSITIEDPASIVNIQVQVRTAVSGTMRLGIYADDDSHPGKLIIDAGTVDTSTTGAKTVTFAAQNLRGRYWVAGICDAAPNLTCISTTNAANGSSNNTTMSGITGYYWAASATEHTALPADQSAQTYIANAAGSTPCFLLGE